MGEDENVTRCRWKRDIGKDPDVTQILKLVENNSKANTINKFKAMEKNVVIMKKKKKKEENLKITFISFYCWSIG